ncbi:PREDICTED: uncharacterized protein LOC108776059 [Cyphomyrmex costatus]|uniref:uncharacterized protein LOC108776059 n=1 Tax=Cyphomyrmex costatus TaxID=456900 RepID=UPI0008522CAD|nr:PREDICTED: uncharacterized protein LOC108776059 [Cyphomyrmex costatus]
MLRLTPYVRDVRLYGSPSAMAFRPRSHGTELADAQLASDKKPWVPTKNTRICSVHFVGGEKSNDARKESFYPTLFPSIYKKKSTDLRRAERLEARIKKIEDRDVPMQMKHIKYDLTSDFYEVPNTFEIALSAENRLLLFLMKMKHGLPFSTLGSLFQISRTSAANIFKSVLKILVLNTKTWLFWPSKEAIKETMPSCFMHYPNCRAIIDCTEISCDTPPTVEQRILMYSHYKSNFTIKFLVAISPSGLITFISKAYGGKATDGFITNDSGFLNLIEPGDEIMADKGFPQIKVELLLRQCTIVMPPFAFNPQFSREEVLEGYSIASVRIHVERAIQRIKIF